MPKWMKWISFVIAVLFATDGYAEVCRLPNLAGYEQMAARAKRVLPKETRNINEIAVYVERDPKGGFYYHSNFISERHEYPTKIGNDPRILDLAWALQNIVWTQRPNAAREQMVRDAYLKHARIFVDRSVFRPDGTTELVFGDKDNITLVDANARSATRAIAVRTDTPPRLIAELISGCCLHARPVGAGALAVRDGLRDIKLDQREVKIASLVSDSATMNALRSGALRTATAQMNPGTVRSVSDLRLLFEEQRGKQVIVIGHVEGGNFVIRDARGVATATLAIPELRALALQNDVLLIEVGCNTAGVVQDGVAAVGVATRFNTVDAVQRMSRAFESSKTLADFLGSMADESVKVVVDVSAVARSAVFRARYVDVGTTSLEQKVIAEVNVVTGSISLVDRIRRAFSLLAVHK